IHLLFQITRNLCWMHRMFPDSDVISPFKVKSYMKNTSRNICVQAGTSPYDCHSLEVLILNSACEQLCSSFKYLSV
ncbi:hypothetical protein XENORESO_006136, partial [Xenotaenia resolanae]